MAEANIAPNTERWTAIGNQGFKFKDTTGAADGIRRITLRASDADQTKVVLKAKDVAVSVPPLQVPLTAQLINGDTNTCWSTTYGAADMSRNENGVLRAKTASP